MIQDPADDFNPIQWQFVRLVFLQELRFRHFSLSS